MSHLFWKFDPANAARLLSGERWKIHPPDEAMALLDARGSHVVADIGCGPGFFTIPIAQRVQPAGRVAALDIAPEMLSQLRRRVTAAGLINVVPARSEESLLPLSGDSCDRVLLAFLLHELETPDLFFQEVRRVVRPGGRGVVVDWTPRPSPAGPPLEVRVPAADAVEQLKVAGLTPVAPVDFGPHGYAIVFSR